MIRNRSFRRILAAAFLIVLLAEWGSHGVSFVKGTSTAEQAYSFLDGNHEDPCATLLICKDGSRRERQAAAAGHDIAHNAYWTRVLDLRRFSAVPKNPGIPRAAVHRVFRSLSPPFHPPELS